MSTYVGKFLTAVSSALEFNTATLSGAIDIIVIEDDNGHRQCSPFHVRFGKLQLLKSRGIPVEIELNGHRTNLRMLLGAAGEAYFHNPNLHSAHHELFSPVSDPIDPVDPSQSAPMGMSADDINLPVHSASQPLPNSVRSYSEDVAVKSSFHTAEHSKESYSSLSQKQRFSLSATSNNSSHPLFPTTVSETIASDYPFGYISDSEVELTRIEREGTAEVVDEPRSPPLNTSQRRWMSSRAQNMNTKHLDIALPTGNIPVAATKSRSCSSSTSDEHVALFGLPASPPSPSTPPVDLPKSLPQDEHPSNAIHSLQQMQLTRSPTSNETSPNQEMIPEVKGAIDSLVVSDSMSDVEGQEESRLECRSVDGYEADEDTVEMLQDQVSYVLSKRDSSSRGATASDFRDAHESNVQRDAIASMSDSNAQIEMSSPLMVSSGEPVLSPRDSTAKRASSLGSNQKKLRKDGVVAMSLCGGLLGRDMQEEEMMEIFERHRVSHSDFVENPKILHDPSLLFRIDDRLVEYSVAAPFIFSILAFNERMDMDELARRTSSKAKVDTPKSPRTSSRRFGWFGWASTSVVGEPLLQEEDIEVLKQKEEIENSAQDTSGNNTKPDVDHSATAETREIASVIPPAVTQESEQNHKDEPSEQVNISTAESSNRVIAEPEAFEAITFSELDPESLSLRPTPDELNELDLKPGANTIRFFVKSSSVELRCRIFLWGCHSKIVISDVDGTITRSDVLGHLLPAVGRDWSQVGVAGLYTQIEKNGYKILYLTARPIGQASQTRTFLHNVTQGSAKLPTGPVLMSPNRLVESFTREVIRRKPHEFKIAALREIRFLFSPDYNPFHAGFGNRDTDVISYRAVGLIPQRIFVVNPKGELVVMKAKYESTASYSSLQDLVESVFPDISGKEGPERIKALTESATYNDWNYWRAKLPDVDLDALLSK